MLIFTIPGDPQGKARPRLGRGKAFTPRKTVIYENWIKACFVKEVGRVQNLSYSGLTAALKIDMECTYPIVASTSKKKRAEMLAGNIKPTKKPDLDNVAKCVLDALNELAYKDDCQVVELTITKHFGESPKIIVRIEETT